MVRIHDLFIVELAEVIKGYGNDPDVEDPFSLSEFYRFYELPNIAVSRENFEKMRPVEPERKRGKWKPIRWSGRIHKCNQCGNILDFGGVNAGRGDANFCPNCGADMRGGDSE